MSPGVTFGRVYHELKRRLAEGMLKPGEAIEPAQIGAEIAASITPIRDALHRLTGERLVETPNHNGFRVPRPSEAELRDLYLWNGRLLVLALRHIDKDRLARIALPAKDSDPCTAATDLFQRIAEATGSDEHARAIAQLSDRLDRYRRAEALILDGLDTEYAAITLALEAADPPQLARALTRYHRRRAAAASAILAAVLKD